MSSFDIFYRKFLLSKFFEKGWGNPALLLKIIDNQRVVSKRETCMHLINSFDIKIAKQTVESNATIVEGSFISPFYKLIPESMDSNNQVAKFQLIIPNRWTSKYKPLCIHYAGTGDHNFTRRKFFLADRLLKDGIASMIHINPFYYTRKPKDQKGSSLNYLFDLFVMGGALILEAQVLLRWASKHGFGPLAIHGISMGGHMACLGASVYPEPLCIIPCLSWTTASHVFTEAAMSQAVSWDILSQQYHNDTIFSGSIRAAIEPPLPYHFQKTSPHESSTSSCKPSKPLDSGNQNNFNNSDKSSSNLNLKMNMKRLWPMELISTMWSFSENGKITKDEIEAFDRAETQFRNNNSKSKTIFSQRQLIVDKETMDFMRDILNFFTHLANYSVPVDTRLVTVVVAENDAYIPIDGVAHFNEVWGSQCEVQILKAQGHVGTYLRNSVWTDDKFRDAIVRTMNRYIELYHKEPGPLGEKKLKFGGD